MAVNHKRGFALLISVIFMSVMLSFGLALGSLGYKQQVLASSAVASQYAFYAADAALECALYADQQLNPFAYAKYVIGNPPNMSCDGKTHITTQTRFAEYLVSTVQLPLDEDPVGNPKHCADVTIYKYRVPRANGETTSIFSQGYDVPCTTVNSLNGARFVSRGLSSHF